MPCCISKNPLALLRALEHEALCFEVILPRSRDVELRGSPTCIAPYAWAAVSTQPQLTAVMKTLQIQMELHVPVTPETMQHKEEAHLNGHDILHVLFYCHVECII